MCNRQTTVLAVKENRCLHLRMKCKTACEIAVGHLQIMQAVSHGLSLLIKYILGLPKVVQWLGFHASTAEGRGSLIWELRSSMLQAQPKQTSKP